MLNLHCVEQWKKKENQLDFASSAITFPESLSQLPPDVPSSDLSRFHMMLFVPDLK